MINNYGASIKKSTADRVADYLREQIITKKMSLGERLVEANLAKSFETSITPVRQALMKLTAEGLIVTYPYKGSYVTDIDENLVSNLVDCRRFIEGEAAKTAYQRIYDKNPHVLMDLIEGAQQIGLRPHNMYDICRYDMMFHRYIVEHSDNTILLDLWDTISSRIMLLQAYAKREISFERFYRNHYDIADSLKQGKGEQHLAEAVLEHLNNADTSSPALILTVAEDRKNS